MIPSIRRHGAEASVPNSSGSAICFPEDPARTAGEARLVWADWIDPGVVTAGLATGARDSRPMSPADAELVAVVGPGAVTHVCIVAFGHRLRIDVIGSRNDRFSLGQDLVFSLPTDARLAARLDTLTRLDTLLRAGRLPPLPAPRRVRPRDLLVLRAGDAWLGGETQRSIAELLFGAGLVARDWRGSTDYLRARTRRLIEEARYLRDGGWRLLLAQ